jgi:hypothetical protein
METRGEDSLKGMRILKKVQRTIAILVLTITCIGCSAGAYVGTQSAGDSRFNNLLIGKKIGADHPPVLVVGSMFVYQDTNLSNSKVCRVTMVVKEKGEFEKKQAYWIDVTREGENYLDVYDMNFNWIGSFADGRELESAEPCIQVFKWPLKVGKKWDNFYTLRDYSQGINISSSTVPMNIRTYEEVTVPAGTFNALRIQAGEETFWYALSIGWVVKEQIGSYGKDGWLLELVEYSIPPIIAEKERVVCLENGIKEGRQSLPN